MTPDSHRSPPSLPRARPTQWQALPKPTGPSPHRHIAPKTQLHSLRLPGAGQTLLVHSLSLLLTTGVGVASKKSHPSTGRQRVPMLYFLTESCRLVSATCGPAALALNVQSPRPAPQLTRERGRRARSAPRSAASALGTSAAGWK